MPHTFKSNSQRTDNFASAPTPYTRIYILLLCSGWSRTTTASSFAILLRALNVEFKFQFDNQNANAIQTKSLRKHTDYILNMCKSSDWQPFSQQFVKFMIRRMWLWLWLWLANSERIVSCLSVVSCRTKCQTQTSHLLYKHTPTPTHANAIQMRE